LTGFETAEREKSNYYVGGKGRDSTILFGREGENNSKFGGRRGKKELREEEQGEGGGGGVGVGLHYEGKYTMKKTAPTEGEVKNISDRKPRPLRRIGQCQDLKTPTVGESSGGKVTLSHTGKEEFGNIVAT